MRLLVSLHQNVPTSPDPVFLYPWLCVCYFFISCSPSQVPRPKPCKLWHCIVSASFRKIFSFVYQLYYITFYCRLPCKLIFNQFADSSKQGQTNCDISPLFMAMNTNLKFPHEGFLLVFMYMLKFYESKNKYRRNLICLI